MTNKNYRIILRDGSIITLEEFQKSHGLTGLHVSKNFSLDGDPQLVDEDGNFCMSEIVIEVLQRLRDKRGRATIVNSGCRTKAAQKSLKGTGVAATNSPHPEGMAIDADTVSFFETGAMVRHLMEISKETGIKIRIGWETYKKIGYTMVHFDICPEYFAAGKPYHNIKHPVQWESPLRW